MKRFYFLFILVAFTTISLQAQIGYQVAILDPSTGKAKINERVEVLITITDNAGNVICSEKKSDTTNEVGIVSLQIGNAGTFDKMDWNNLPLWVSATIGETTISKSQILNVPVAEFAKKTSEIDIKEVRGSWYAVNDDEFLVISSNSITFGEDDWSETYHIEFLLHDGIVCHRNDHGEAILHFNGKRDTAFWQDEFGSAKIFKKR